MADWWETAPLASASIGAATDRVAASTVKGEDWWQAAPLAKQPGAIEDIGKAALIGAPKGAINIAGLPGDVSGLVGRGVEAAGNLVGLQAKPLPEPRNGLESALMSIRSALEFPTSKGIRKTVEGVTGPLYDPKTTAGEYAQTATEFLPNMIGGPLSLGRAATNVALPALASETAGQATKGTALEPYARLGGAVLGGSGALRGAAETLAAPLTSQIRARLDPASYAQGQVGRMIQESGHAPADLAAELQAAARQGQGEFTLADALGNAGQRGLSAVTRAPGPGRQDAVNFLDARQAGQGRRVANALAEGFDAPQTAAQVEQRLTAARDTASDANYGAVRADALPVDVTRVIGRIDQTVRPGVNQIARPQSGIAPDSAEAALESFRNRLTDGRSMLTDFESVQRVRGDLRDAIGRAHRAGEGNKERLLLGVQREMDAALGRASQGFRQAQAEHAAASRAIDAVDLGRQAANRGRTEDTIPAFQAMPANQQQAFRAGYIDPLIGRVQGAPFGANKAREFTSDAFGAEAGAMAPLAAQLGQRLNRENTMFRTRETATGGSRTTDNFADAAALSIEPSLVHNVLTGRWGAAAQGMLAAGSRFLSGSTPAVRAEVGRLLLTRGGNVTPAQLEQIINDAVARVASRTRGGATGILGGAIAAQGGGGLLGGLGAMAPLARTVLQRAPGGRPMRTAPLATGREQAVLDAGAMEVALGDMRRARAQPDPGLFPIRETPTRAAERSATGFPKMVRVDAAKLRNAFEADQGEALAWNPARTQKIQGIVDAGTPINDYPRVGVVNGRIGVDDGRHRIGVAADRGQQIDVAVNDAAQAKTLQDRINASSTQDRLAAAKADREARRNARAQPSMSAQDENAAIEAALADVRKNRRRNR